MQSHKMGHRCWDRLCSLGLPLHRGKLRARACVQLVRVFPPDSTLTTNIGSSAPYALDRGESPSQRSAAAQDKFQALSRLHDLQEEREVWGSRPGHVLGHTEHHENIQS